MKVIVGIEVVERGGKEKWTEFEVKSRWERFWR
jgi:hypothetical protein